MRWTKRKTIFVCAASLLLLVYVVFFSNVFDVAVGDGSKRIPVRLKVTDAATGKVITGAKLTLVEPEGRPVQIAETETDAEGNAEFRLVFQTSSHEGWWVYSWMGTVPYYSLTVTADDYEPKTVMLVDLFGQRFDMPREEFVAKVTLTRAASPARDP